MIRLEYSEKQNAFHFADLKDNRENTNGYETICPVIDRQEALDFIDQVHNKFKNATLKQVNDLFDEL